MSSPPDEDRPLTRQTLPELTERVLRRARGAKPAILLARLGDQRVIVKDFSHAPWLIRQVYGRWVVARECKAYHLLEGVRGIPAFRGRLGAFAFATDYIEGATLKALPHGDIPAACFDRLAALLDELHARGVVHFDLHQKTNIVLTPGGEPHLVDFASALCLGRGWLAQRLLVPLFGRADRWGLLKLKARYRPESIIPGEARRLRRARALQWLWPPTLLRRLCRACRPKRRSAKKRGA